jgi:hypothetical protein
MGDSLRSRIETRAGQSVLRSSGVPVDDVLARLEKGESLPQVGQSLGLGAGDLIASLEHAALGAGPDDGPPLVQAKPRRPALASAVSEESLARLLPNCIQPARLALAAGLLQILDFWDASHEAAQKAGDLGERAVSSYWHGVAHRREPDAGNAAYWFRRVGRHASFPALAEAARPLLEAHRDATLTARLCPRESGWDPFAMIDFCTSARRGSTQEALARRLQRLEMEILLDATAVEAGCA